ncbi:hypothetical protein ACN3XK_63535 [Actinomadura welshii]
MTLHTGISLLVAAVIAMGFVMVPMKDGSSTNPGGAIAGLLAVAACVPPALPLVIGAARRWISHWWVVGHAALTLAAIVLLVYAVRFEQVAPT